MGDDDLDLSDDGCCCCSVPASTSSGCAAVTLDVVVETVVGGATIRSGRFAGFGIDGVRSRNLEVVVDNHCRRLVDDWASREEVSRWRERKKIS